MTYRAFTAVLSCSLDPVVYVGSSIQHPQPLPMRLRQYPSQSHRLGGALLSRFTTRRVRHPIPLLQIHISLAVLRITRTTLVTAGLPRTHFAVARRRAASRAHSFLPHPVFKFSSQAPAPPPTSLRTLISESRRRPERQRRVRETETEKGGARLGLRRTLIDRHVAGG